MCGLPRRACQPITPPVFYLMPSCLVAASTWCVPPCAKYERKRDCSLTQRKSGNQHRPDLSFNSIAWVRYCDQSYSPLHISLLSIRCCYRSHLPSWCSYSSLHQHPGLLDRSLYSFLRHSTHSSPRNNKIFPTPPQPIFTGLLGIMPTMQEFAESLQVPPIVLHRSTRSACVRNTRSKLYSSRDISGEIPQFRKELYRTIDPLPAPIVSPLGPFHHESDPVTLLDRTVLLTLGRMLPPENLEVRHRDFFDNGCDLMVFEDATKKLRLVGDIKASWKFSSHWTESTRNLKNEYRQVVSQLHHYMWKGKLRYCRATGKLWRITVAGVCLFVCFLVCLWRSATVERT